MSEYLDVRKADSNKNFGDCIAGQYELTPRNLSPQCHDGTQATNKKFGLFHSIDKHFREKCHVLTVLKSAKSLAHAMIAAMVPYLLWQHAQSQPGPKALAI